MKRYVGASSSKPKFARFNYGEKAKNIGLSFGERQ